MTTITRVLLEVGSRRVTIRGGNLGFGKEKATVLVTGVAFKMPHPNKQIPKPVSRSFTFVLQANGRFLMETRSKSRLEWHLLNRLEVTEADALKVVVYAEAFITEQFGKQAKALIATAQAV